MSINFKETKDELTIAEKIADRALEFFPQREKIDIILDIVVTHCSGCKLKLDELLRAGDFDFKHDIEGINRHLNHETGELEDFFIPRYAEQ